MALSLLLLQLHWNASQSGNIVTEVIYGLAD